MEKKLRKRFVLIFTSITFVVLFSLVVFINLTANRLFDAINNMAMNIIAENDGEIPRESIDSIAAPPHVFMPFSGDRKYSLRYFYVELGEDNIVLSSNFDNISPALKDSSMEMLEKFLEENENGFKDSEGEIGSFEYRIIDNGNTRQFVFLSNEEQAYIIDIMINILSYLFAIVFVLVFILSCIFSKKAVAPIVNAQEKQKEFITNVSHELKTPLAIIKANTEVIEAINGETDWTNSNHSQVKRMNTLVSYLLTLTKFEEKNDDKIKTDFSITEMVENTVDNYKSLLAENNKQFNINTNENITLTAHEESIRMLISVLLENAVKYSKADSVIDISLTKKSNKTIIQIENEADDLKVGNYDNLFERFYKEDKARSYNNSFGIGLSIAKSIVENHKGEISAKSLNGKTIIFTVVI